MPDEKPSRCPSCGHVKLPQEDLCYACRIMAECRARQAEEEADALRGE